MVKIEEAKKLLKSQLIEINNLQKSVLDKAFKGKL